MEISSRKRRWLAVAVLAAAIAFYNVAALRVPFLSLACKAGIGRSCAALAGLYADELVPLVRKLAMNRGAGYIAVHDRFHTVG